MNDTYIWIDALLSRNLTIYIHDETMADYKKSSDVDIVLVGENVIVKIIHRLSDNLIELGVI